MSGNALLERIDAYAQAIRERRPLTTDEVKELDAYFRIGMTYTSNALEGNSLTLSETKVLLEDGITVGGKPIRDCYEATGHARAYDYSWRPPGAGPCNSGRRIYSACTPCSTAALTRSTPDATGKARCSSPARNMSHPRRRRCLAYGRLVEELNKRRDAMHPVLLAAYAHRRLVDIHPFQDGNGAPPGS